MHHNDCIANYSIHCTVKNCQHHKGDENYCSLDTVSIGTHEQKPTDSRCVDCNSFSCASSDKNSSMS